jgi:hypothetical protein
MAAQLRWETHSGKILSLSMASSWINQRESHRSTAIYGASSIETWSEFFARNSIMSPKDVSLQARDFQKWNLQQRNHQQP